MSAETPVSQNSNVPICERRSESRPSFDSPLIAETGISHNITRILNGHQQPIKDVSDTVRERSRAARYSPYDVAYTASSKQARHERCQSTDAVETEMSAATGINEHRGTPNTSDCSMSSFESLSPISSSSTADTASPTENGSDSSQTDADLAASPDNKPDQKKKLARTNYTKEQLKTLMKIFHENPYPDSEMMDSIAKDFGVKETNIKIWFQNKRARWRRRVENVNNSMQSYTPSATMMSPYASYGFPYNQVTPQQVYGYQNYPWMQTGTFSHNNNQLLPAFEQNIALSSSSYSPFPSSLSYSQMVNTTSYPSAAQNIRTSQLQAIYPNNMMYRKTMLHGVY
ncbi:hypothetical protein DPMN_177091 [Dreissena polymorpha]|uniref:Homeobox domain-containing protein n=1 Tax=Dreissena polymorpha TaxID=45954 RepID=A0A9D4IIP5_DREPO|nr:hypothetical protein DPMN_177091 [Dreissena polymorpha]